MWDDKEEEEVDEDKLGGISAGKMHARSLKFDKMRINLFGRHA